MSDKERWDETRRLGRDQPAADDPDATRRVERPAGGAGPGPAGAGPGGGADPGQEHTRRLGPEPGAQDPTEQAHRLDAVGDSTYEDPYDEGYRAGPATTTYAEEEHAEYPGEPPRRRDGPRSALLLLLGVGLGFLAALVVVALFGGEGGDLDELTTRDARITALEEQLAEREQEVEGLEATVEQRDQQITDLQAGLDDTEGDMAQREQALDDREQALDDREQQLDDRERALDEREEQIAQREEDPDAPDDDGSGDLDVPEFDDDDAEAFIDRIIEGIRDLFR